MKIDKKYISKNRSYKSFRPRGVVIHETGNTSGAGAMAHFNYFNTVKSNSSAHIVLDDECALQLVPYDEVAYHAGKTANNAFLGIEICRCVPFDQKRFDKEYKAAVEIVAELFECIIGTNNISKNNLLSHAEVSALWRETDHQDPTEYFKKGGKSMDDFRRDVTAKMRISYDETVDDMVRDNITDRQNMAYWEKVFCGKEPVNLEYLRTILKRYHERGCK